MQQEASAGRSGACGCDPLLVQPILVSIPLRTLAAHGFCAKQSGAIVGCRVVRGLGACGGRRMRCAVSCLPPADVGVGIGAIAAHSATPDRLTGLRSAHRAAHTHPDPLAPGNMAAQLSLARCSGRVISSRQVVAPRRLSAALVQHTRRPVVARSVVEVEAANSAKHGEQGRQQRRGAQCARLQGAGPGRPGGRLRCTALRCQPARMLFPLRSPCREEAQEGEGRGGGGVGRPRG